ncbi:hypothetical protein RCL1_006329 [Eukaryota sp. TZLM3-RCL]
MFKINFKELFNCNLELLNISILLARSSTFSKQEIDNKGGIGLTKASVLVKSAFLGGLRNFLFEFKLRFPNEDIENSSVPFLLEGKKLVDSLPEDTWARLFSFTSEVKEKKMSNLEFTFKKLQNKLKIIYESDTFKKNLKLG